MKNDMAWIKVHEEIATHYKTERLADQLNLPPAQAAGHLLFLWLFTVRNAWRDGDLSKWGDNAIERGAGWQGGKGVLVDALRSSGWLDGSEVHDWQDVAGVFIKQKQSNEKQYLKNKSTVATPNESPVATPNDLPGYSPGEDKIRLDKIRLEENIKVSTPQAIRLCDLLISKMLLNNPKVRLPKNKSDWEGVIDLMLTKDKRTEKEIESVINFCQSDGFWKTNILSTAKLREKFDQLFLKMEGSKNGYSQGIGSGNGRIVGTAAPTPGKFDHLG